MVTEPGCASVLALVAGRVEVACDWFPGHRSAHRFRWFARGEWHQIRWLDADPRARRVGT